MDDSLQQQFAQIEAVHWWFQGRRHIVGTVIAPYLPLETSPGQRPRIFDVGCGTGEMLDMLSASGTVAAIDVSEQAVQRCKQRFGDVVAVAVGRVPDDLPTRGSADVLTAFDVIEHLDDDGKALRGFHRSLSDGGTLVVTVPALNLLWGPHDVLNHHRRRYTRSQLRQRLEDAGFAVIRISYFNTWLFPVVAMVRATRRLRNRGEQPEAASDFTMPSPLVNRFLLALFSSEAAVLRRCSLPIGVSLLAVCRKPAGQG